MGKKNRHHNNRKFQTFMDAFMDGDRTKRDKDFLALYYRAKAKIRIGSVSKNGVDVFNRIAPHYERSKQYKNPDAFYLWLICSDKWWQAPPKETPNIVSTDDFYSVI